MAHKGFLGRAGAAVASCLLGALLLGSCGKVGASRHARPASGPRVRQAAGGPEPTERVKPRKTSRALASPRADIPGLENFAQVSPVLFRSAQPTGAGFRELRKRGVRTIVSLRALHSDRDELQGLGMNYIRISFKPWHAEDEDVVKFLKVVTNPQHQPVLVHCQHGADRTGAMVAIYRVCEQGWTMEDAMQELPRFKFHWIWTNLKNYLLNLDVKKLREKVARAAEPAVDFVE